MKLVIVIGILIIGILSGIAGMYHWYQKERSFRRRRFWLDKLPRLEDSGSNLHDREVIGNFIEELRKSYESDLLIMNIAIVIFVFMVGYGTGICVSQM